MFIGGSVISRTLGQVRPELTTVAGTTGMSVTDPRFIARLNLAQEELMNEGDFPGVVDRYRVAFSATTGEVVIPYWLDRLMAVTVDRIPQQMMSPWAEFYAYGPGPQSDPGTNAAGNPPIPFPSCWLYDVFDRGETVSYTKIPHTNGPWVLRVYASVDEKVDGYNPLINLQGFDPNGQIIRSRISDGTSLPWENGIVLPIDFDVPFSESTQEFASLTAVVKPETNGYVRLTAWNGSVEVELSNYAPVETTPSYRRYYIPSLWRSDANACPRILLARARKRFVPVAEPQDTLIISNINALKCMIIAQWKRDAGNYDAYKEQKIQAVDILQKEAMGYLGKSRSPALTFQYGTPLGVMPFVH